MIDLSVVIPCYKKEGIIRQALRDKIAILDSMNINYQIIAVIDGEIDNTKNEIHRVGSRNVKILSYKKNKGKGYAVREGLNYANGKYISYIDADMDIDPIILKEMYEQISKENLEIVNANKFSKISVYKKSLLRKIMSNSYRKIIKTLFGIGVEDTQTGAKIFKKDVIKSILPFCIINGFAFDVEIFTIAAKKGFKNIKEIPVNIRHFPNSTIRPKLIFKMIFDTFKIFTRYKIKRIV